MSTSYLSNAAMPVQNDLHQSGPMTRTPSVRLSQSGPMRRTSAVPRSVLLAQIRQGGCGLHWCVRTRPDHFAPRDCDCSSLGGQSHQDSVRVNDEPVARTPSVVPPAGPMRRTSAVPASVLLAQIRQGGCGLSWCERTRPDHFAPRDCDCTPLGGQSHQDS